MPTKTLVISIKAPFTLLRFCTKNREENHCFCESVLTDLHKNATKTEVFDNAFEQCERTKTEVFENAPISNNELHKTVAM